MSRDSSDSWRARIPPSLGEPHELAVAILRGWGRVIGILEGLSKVMRKGLNPPAAEELVKDSTDLVVDDLMDLQAELLDFESALNLVVDEFGAEETPVGKLKGYYAPSAHELVFRFATGKWLGLWYRIAVEIKGEPELTDFPADLRLATLARVDLLAHFEVVTAICIEPPRLLGDDALKLEARLDQELYRAYNRRQVAERKDSPKRPPPGPCVSVDQGRGKIIVADEECDAEPTWCSIVQHLIEAKGEYRTGPKMRNLAACKGKKIWKEIKRLEDAAPAIKDYLKHEGNKGYRLLNG